MKKYLLFFTLAIGLVVSCHRTDLRQDAKENQTIEWCGTESSPVAALANERRAQSGVSMSSARNLANTFVIYLDYDGQVINSPYWGNFTAAASTLSASDKATIKVEVEEDFSPFTYTITEDSNVYHAVPSGDRIRVVIGNGLTPYLGAVGGLSLIGSALWTDSVEAFVLADNLTNTTRKVAIAISHETGHTLGLYHDGWWNFSNCTITSSYDVGVGVGNAESAGRIMGAAYTSNLVHWDSSRVTVNGGSPPNCGILQNDFNIIAANLPFKADPDRNSVPSIVIVNGIRSVGPSQTISGGGESIGDVDVIKFIGSGVRTLNLTTYGNLDAQIDLYKLSGGSIIYYTTISPVGNVNISQSINMLGVVYIVVRAAINTPYATSPRYLLGKWSLQII